MGKVGLAGSPRSTPTLNFAEEIHENSQAPGWPAQPLISTATGRLTADTVAGCGGAGSSVCDRPDGTRWFSPGGTTRSIGSSFEGDDETGSTDKGLLSRYERE